MRYLTVYITARWMGYPTVVRIMHGQTVLCAVWQEPG